LVAKGQSAGGTITGAGFLGVTAFMGILRFLGPISWISWPMAFAIASGLISVVTIAALAARKKSGPAATNTPGENFNNETPVLSAFDPGGVHGMAAVRAITFGATLVVGTMTIDMTSIPTDQPYQIPIPVYNKVSQLDAHWSEATNGDT